MNGQSKIGQRELEIIEYLQQKGEAAYAQLLEMFSPTVRNPTGKEYLQYEICADRLRRMVGKGFIETDGKIVRLTKEIAREP